MSESHVRRLTKAEIVLSVRKGVEAVAKHKDNDYEDHPCPKEVQFDENSKVSSHGDQEHTNEDYDTSPWVGHLGKVNIFLSLWVKLPMSAIH